MFTNAANERIQALEPQTRERRNAKPRLLERMLVGLLSILLASIAPVHAQQSSPVPPAKPAANANDSAEFLRTTDEVMAEMSKILGLAQLEPLKKTLRSREDIRAYVLQQMKEDKEPEKRYADERVLEKLGMVPKDFPMDNFLVDLLTEQIAGLYDPKAKEFYIADWIPPADQREVMAHELTHALQDQHYKIDPWRDAAKPNDDAEAARDAVLEGAAVAAMIDYGLRQQGSSLADLGNMSFSTLLGNLDSSPMLMKAPAFLRDSLIFPYAAGADFSQAVLRARGGWPGFHAVFENPPVSTQQILHPELYFKGVVPEAVSLPDLGHDLPSGWKMLDSNVLGEFGLEEILKRFTSESRSDDLAPAWAGDRYAIYERKETKDAKETAEDLLVFRIHTNTPSDAARLFGGLSEAYDQKYQKRENFLRRPNYYSFDSNEGGVFLRCTGADCVSMEGGDRKLFDEFVHALGWPANPDPAPIPGEVVKTAAVSHQPIPPTVSRFEIQP